MPSKGEAERAQPREVHHRPMTDLISESGDGKRQEAQCHLTPPQPIKPTSITYHLLSFHALMG